MSKLVKFILVLGDMLSGSNWLVSLGITWYFLLESQIGQSHLATNGKYNGKYKKA